MYRITMLVFKDAGFFWTFEGLPLEMRIKVPAKGSYPPACFDHIMTKGLGRPTAKVLSEAIGSDHLPVVTDLTINN